MKRVKTKAIHVISIADFECMTVINVCVLISNVMGVIQHNIASAWFQIEYIYQVYGIKSIFMLKTSGIFREKNIEKKKKTEKKQCMGGIKSFFHHIDNRRLWVVVVVVVFDVKAIVWILFLWHTKTIYFNIRRVFARHFPVDDNEKSRTRPQHEHKHI